MKSSEVLDLIRKNFPFPTPREGQIEIILKILKAYSSGKRYVVLSAPTGVGKSVIGYTVAKILEESYILTSQKVLQKQYYDDFVVPFVLGRANYQCLKIRNCTCDNGWCMKIPDKTCRDKSGNAICPYIKDRENALSSNHSNLSYAYFFATCGNETIGKRKLIVCDEAHSVEKELLNIYQIKITASMISWLGMESVSIPKTFASDEDILSWTFNDFKEALIPTVAYWTGKVKMLSKMKKTREFKNAFEKANEAKNVLEKLVYLENHLNAETKSLVATYEPEISVSVKPLFCKGIFRKFLDGMGDYFLFMSATILNPKKYIETLGLDERLCEIIECDSPFPVENRLIQYTPVGSMSFKNKMQTLPKMYVEVDNILRAYPNVKGIIHTVNYDIAEKLIENLRFSPEFYRLILPKGSDKQFVLNSFYASTEPMILVSPSLTEGIDLKDDLSRLCIICKMPYPNLSDKWTKMRMELDKEWYSTQTCTTLVQMSGRSIRSKDDFATTFILDSDFMILANSASWIFPKWWKESVVVP